MEQTIPEVNPSGFYVFLAEDDGDLRGLIAEVLRADGHFVVESSNGETMLFNLVRLGVERRDLGQFESVVICDIRMPGCDGLSLLRNMREHGFPCPPFVFTTAFPEPEVVREAYELGALEILAKPFELGDLRRLVRTRAASMQPRE